jgi:O-succinylhomoserine sulfhydrylase
LKKIEIKAVEMSDYKHFETKAVRTQIERSQHREHSVPIYATSSFVFNDAEQARSLFADEEDGNIYTRFSNPNNDEFIQKLCALEGTEDGMSMASGMAAMYTSMAAFLQHGDHVLASRSLFGSTHQIITRIFPKWGIEHTYVDVHEPETWKQPLVPIPK